MRPVAIFLIRCYQAFHGSFFWGSCRFHPTCSHYAIEAIDAHGLARGFFLAAWRVLRCQPFCKGGWDPVPAARIRAVARPRIGLTARTRRNAVPLTSTNFSRRSL